MTEFPIGGVDTSFDKACDEAFVHLLDGIDRIPEDHVPGAWEQDGLRPGFPVLNPACWDGMPVPPRRWLVKDMIPKGTVTSIYGDGASGKSTLCLQLAIARASGHQWLGFHPEPGRTLYLSAEDDTDELHRRCEKIRNHYGVSFNDLADLIIADLVGHETALAIRDRDGSLRTSKLFRFVQQLIQTYEPSVVVLDSLADFFAGNEIDRQHARQFIRLLNKLCREFNLTVIVIAHPSLSGMSNGHGSSGNTAWSNSVRSRLYFEISENDKDARVLTTKKANYAKMGSQVEMRWVDGAFITPSAEDKSYAIAAETARNAAADEKFLELLRRFNKENRTVSAKPRAPNNAPSEFSKHIDAGGFLKDEIKAAMDRLLKKGVIKQVETGCASRRRCHLIEVEEGWS